MSFMQELCWFIHSVELVPFLKAKAAVRLSGAMGWSILSLERVRTAQAQGLGIRVVFTVPPALGGVTPYASIAQLLPGAWCALDVETAHEPQLRRKPSAPAPSTAALRRPQLAPALGSPAGRVHRDSGTGAA